MADRKEVNKILIFFLFSRMRDDHFRRRVRITYRKYLLKIWKFTKPAQFQSVETSLVELLSKKKNSKIDPNKFKNITKLVPHLD
jgi:hypothetical protein